MGYFNNNSLGYITSVATNTMEHLADVATRVVMLVTQGILTTLIITAMMFLFDVRIGLTALAGVGVYFLINTQMQVKGKQVAPIKDSSDRVLVEKVLEYLQGIGIYYAI